MGRIKKKNSIQLNDYTSLEFCVEIIDAAIFVNAKTKIYYNAKHYLLLLNLNNKIYLRLNYKYYLLKKLNKKVLLQ